MRPRPVSKVCPKCGETNFRPSKPVRFIAFAWDRKCTECSTIYTAPTPVWAAILFILIGVVMFGAGGFFVGANILVAMNNPARSAPLGLVLFSVVAALGVLSIIQGVRVLLKPGKV